MLWKNDKYIIAIYYMWDNILEGELFEKYFTCIPVSLQTTKF